MRLRQKWLRRSLRAYPLYDPPHKIAECLLSREQAIENLDYFLAVRHKRLADFQAWLRRHFWVPSRPIATASRPSIAGATNTPAC